MNRATSTLPEPAGAFPDDFLVHARQEIAGHLRDIAARRLPVSLHYRGPQDFCVTSVLAVDATAGTVVVDTPQDSAVRRAILGAAELTCVVFVDQVKNQFSTARATEMTFEGGPALRLPLPGALLRLQRRSSFRISAPKAKPLVCEVPTPGGEFARFELTDLSIGGAAFVTAPAADGFVPGAVFEDCRIDLSEHGIVAAVIELRSLTPVEAGGKAGLRLGCRFVDLPGTVENKIQRYINDVQRARRAFE